MTRRESRNVARKRIYQQIRERYTELLREGKGAYEAIEMICGDPRVNVLGYAASYIRDIVYRIDPSKEAKSRMS